MQMMNQNKIHNATQFLILGLFLVSSILVACGQTSNTGNRPGATQTTVATNTTFASSPSVQGSPTTDYGATATAEVQAQAQGTAQANTNANATATTPANNATATATAQATCLTISTTSIALTGTQSQSYSNKGNFTITNCGSSAETWNGWQKTSDGTSWMVGDTGIGTLSPGASTTDSVSANLSGLAVGSYSGTLNFSVGSIVAASIAITLTVNPVPQLCLQINPPAVDLSGKLGLVHSNTIPVTLMNCGNVAETWNTVETTDNNMGWIQATPTSSTLNPGASVTIYITAMIAEFQSTGTYYGTLFYDIGSTRETDLSVALFLGS